VEERAKYYYAITEQYIWPKGEKARKQSRSNSKEERPGFADTSRLRENSTQTPKEGENRGGEE